MSFIVYSQLCVFKTHFLIITKRKEYIKFSLPVISVEMNCLKMIVKETIEEIWIQIVTIWNRRMLISWFSLDMESSKYFFCSCRSVAGTCEQCLSAGIWKVHPTLVLLGKPRFLFMNVQKLVCLSSDVNSNLYKPEVCNCSL